MWALNAEQVLNELGEIAFATPGAEGGPPVKMADKLRALELLYKYLGLGEGGMQEPVTVIDDLAAPAAEAAP